MKLKGLYRIFIIVASILLIPLIAMQFTSEVNWQLMDFIIMGLLLFPGFFLVDLIWRSIRNKKYRWIALAIVIILFLLIWVELAVGLFGTPLAGN